MANEVVIEPAVVAPVPVPVPVAIEPTTPQPEEATPQSQGEDLPEDFLKLPAAGPLLAGSPPAMSLSIKDMAKTDDGKIIAKSAGPLQAAGMFFYRGLDKETGVIGNSLYINPEAIKQADEQGQLTSIAPSWNMVAGEASRAGSANPVVTATEVPTGPAPAPAPSPLPPPPASTQTRLAGARAKNLQPGSPTSGPAPGRGRILANLLKPAI